MFNVRLAGDHLLGKCLFTSLSLAMSLVVSCFVLSFFPRHVLDETWLSLVVSIMVSYFVLLFFPRDVLDEIWD